MTIEGNPTNGYFFTDEEATRLYTALDRGFDEAMRTAAQLLNLQGDTHVGLIELLPDESIKVHVTDHLLGVLFQPLNATP